MAQVQVKNGNLDYAIKKYKQNAYDKPGVRRRKAKKEAIKNARKNERRRRKERD